MKIDIRYKINSYWDKIRKEPCKKMQDIEYHIRQTHAYNKIKKNIESSKNIYHLQTTERMMFEFSRLYFDAKLCWNLKMMLNDKTKLILISN